MAFRFVHTAGVHFDSRPATLARRDSTLAESIDGTARAALVEAPG